MNNPRPTQLRPDLHTLLTILTNYQCAEEQQILEELKEIDLYSQYSGNYGQNRKAELLLDLHNIREDLECTIVMCEHIANSNVWNGEDVPLVDLKEGSSSLDIPLF